MSSPQKISQLTTAGPLTGAELVPVVQNGGTLQTTVADFVALANISISPVVSALQTQIDQVSAAAAANTIAITSVQADVSALTIRVASVSAVTSVNAAAITSINNTVSALDARVSTLEIAVSNIGNVSAIAALVTAVASLEGTVSALVVRVAGVSASVSALQVQLNAVSALTSVNTAAITSVNNVVSALEIRVSSASTTGVNNGAAITSINAVISALVISVSADVSAKVNRIGDDMDSVQYIEFNTSTSYAVSAGRLTWDITHGTLDLGLTGTVNLLIGQRTVAQIYNNSGVTLPKGKAVKVTGAQGQRLTGALAQADSDSDSATIFGVMLETVSNLGTGYVATDGVVNNVDTASFTDGDIVYLSPVSAGELTPTKPVAPQHLVQMGYVVKGGSVGAGSLYIKVQNGYELGELHNVKTSAEASIASGEVLIWNASASVWTNSTALLDTQASVSALNIQVAAVSALTSANAASITSANAVIAAISALTSVNAAAITSANAVIAAVSARTSVNAATIAAVSALVSSNTVAIAKCLSSRQHPPSPSQRGLSIGRPTGLEGWRHYDWPPKHQHQCRCTGCLRRRLCYLHQSRIHQRRLLHRPSELPRRRASAGYLQGLRAGSGCEGKRLSYNVAGFGGWQLLHGHCRGQHYLRICKSSSISIGCYRLGGRRLHLRTR